MRAAEVRLERDAGPAAVRRDGPQILVLRLSSLGDVVLSSTFLQACAARFPDAGITYVVRDDLVEVAAALPGVTRVVGVPRRLGGLGLLRLAARLGRTRYAHVFDLHHSLRSRLLVLGLLGRRRRGFGKQSLPRWALVHLHRDWYERFGGALPLRLRMLEPLRQLGGPLPIHATRLRVPEASRLAVGRRLRAAGVRPEQVLVGLAPGARWPSKCWPASRFAALVERLAVAPERRFLLLGGAAERAVGDVAARGAPGQCLDLTGRLDLLETAAALERCTLLVANDSGLVHVAEAVGRPVVALFGPTAPQFGYEPYRPQSRLLRRPPPCSPCSKNGSRPCWRPTHECMENLTLDEVQAAAETLLQSVRPPQLV